MGTRGLNRAIAATCLAAASLGALALSLAAAAPALASFEDAPPFVSPETQQPPAGTRVDVFANRLTYDARSRIATATGTVRLTYGPYTLIATKVVYDMKRNLFRANGSVELREPNGNVLQADMAEINDRFKEGFARHVIALLTNDVTITAHYARRYENGISIFEQATYTACKGCSNEDGTPLWQIVADQVKHDQNTHTLYYHDAKLEIGGVPVFWTPYFSYPDPSVKRRSGFLIPSFNGGNAYGIGVTAPYFWAVAPNADLTFSPRLTTRQSLFGDVEWRHRLRSGIYNVRGYGLYELRPGVTDEESRWRGAVETHGDFAIDSDWSWGWDGALVSDRDFDNDYDVSLGRRGMLTNRVYAVGLSGRNYASAQALQFETLLTEEDQDRLPTALPYVSANYFFDQPVLGGEVGLDVNAYSLSRNEADARFDLGTDQTRAVADLHWRRQMTFGSGLVFTPHANLRNDIYVEQDGPEADGNDRTSAHILPSAGVDVRWPLVADYGIAQSILSPVFQIVAAPNEPDEGEIGNEDAVTLNFDHTNLFLSDRFTGYDRYEGGTRINVGATYDLLGANGGFLRASAGESFHVAGENSFVPGSGLDGVKSDLVGGLALQPNDNVRLTYQARVEEDLSRINVQEASLGLTFDRISGSLSYADIGEADAYGRLGGEQQIWGDARYGFSDAWSLFGSFRYDIEDSSFMEKTIGVAFECDCMKASLSYSETKEEDGLDRRLMMSLELRTIGAVHGGFGL